VLDVFVIWFWFAIVPVVFAAIFVYKQVANALAGKTRIFFLVVWCAVIALFFLLGFYLYRFPLWHGLFADFYGIFIMMIGASLAGGTIIALFTRVVKAVCDKRKAMRRMALYYDCINELRDQGAPEISVSMIAAHMNIEEETVHKDVMELRVTENWPSEGVDADKLLEAIGKAFSKKD
jgi:hypothetical protein